ncbi:rod shape-determining protein RodA [Fodinibacter luteus]|uniref:peptidoglycan glycosyltransferase n=1 Tax=Fodinibacter luteus TaxID=552064 RepID=A0ABP8K791_9MICO
MSRAAVEDRPGLSRLSRLTRHDLGLYVAAGGASVVGALLVWSATSRTDGTAYLVRHLLTAAVGLATALLVSRLGQHRVRLAAPWAYAGSLLALLAVLTPVGRTVNGSRSWIPLVGGFTLQPAELAKVGLCLALAALLAGQAERGLAPGTREVFLAGGLVALPTGLVLLQPDLGSAAVVVALGVVVVTVAGVPRRWLVGAAVLGVALVVVALTTPLLSDYQRDRLTSFADPSSDPQGAGYQTRQVRLAIGAGGMWGQGFMAGERTQGGYVPFQLNDFVFSVAGEELGFVGASGLLVLLGFVVVRVLVVAARARDPFGRLVGVGVATWFAVQILQNVGMNLGLVPVTGLPLPFVSYGGSSMLVAWLAIGLVDAAHARAVPG